MMRRALVLVAAFSVTAASAIPAQQRIRGHPIKREGTKTPPETPPVIAHPVVVVPSLAAGYAVRPAVAPVTVNVTNVVNVGAPVSTGSLTWQPAPASTGTRWYPEGAWRPDLEYIRELEAQKQQQPATPPADSADVKSMDAIIAALYDVISGPAGQKRNWDRFRSLFAPGARLMPTGAPGGGPAIVRMLSPDEYAATSGPMLEQRGFFEREIGRTAEEFGRIAHVFSAYDSRRTASDAQPFARGINSIQLLNDGTRWWIVSVYWDSERPGNPIPAKYLSR